MRATGGAIVLAFALAVTYVPAAGASLSLSEREQKQALVFGQRSVINETFGGEWRVVQGSGESVEVVTPFHRLALAARHAAFITRHSVSNVSTVTARAPTRSASWRSPGVSANDAARADGPRSSAPRSVATASPLRLTGSGRPRPG